MPVTSVKEFTRSYLTLTETPSGFQASHSDGVYLEETAFTSLVLAFHYVLDLDLPVYAQNFSQENFQVFQVLCEQHHVVMLVEGAADTIAKNLTR